MVLKKKDVARVEFDTRSQTTIILNINGKS